MGFLTETFEVAAREPGKSRTVQVPDRPPTLAGSQGEQTRAHRELNTRIRELGPEIAYIAITQERGVGEPIEVPREQQEGVSAMRRAARRVAAWSYSGETPIVASNWELGAHGQDPSMQALRGITHDIVTAVNPDHAEMAADLARYEGDAITQELALEDLALQGMQSILGVSAGHSIEAIQRDQVGIVDQAPIAQVIDLPYPDFPGQAASEQQYATAAL